jgi:cell division protein FtsZ
LEKTLSKTGNLKKSIEEIAREAIPKISVLGVGGAGGNIVTWMKEKEAAGATVIAMNSDAQHLNITKADKKILLGYKVTGGLGCGGYPEKGAEAANESLEEIKKEIAGSGLVIVASGLGGGTGTGASPVAAKLGKEIGALVIGVVTIPFFVERARMLKARDGLKRLWEECDAVVVIDNNRLRKVAGNLPIREAFSVANELIASFIKNLSETIALPSLVNMDFADMRTIMVGGGVCAIGAGEGLGDAKVEDAVETALTTQLLDIADISEAKGALVHVEGGDDMTLDEVNRAAEIVINRVSPTAKSSWGARVNSAMTGSMRVMIVLTGVASPFLSDEIPGFAMKKEEKEPENKVTEELIPKRTEPKKEKGLLNRIFG